MQKVLFTAAAKPGQQLFAKNEKTGEISRIDFRAQNPIWKKARGLELENAHYPVTVEPNHDYRFALNMKNAERKFK